MGLFKKLFALTATAAIAAGGYYVYKNKDKIQRSLKAKKQNIALDLEVFNQTHVDYQNALDAQASLEEEVNYLVDFDKYYKLLKDSYLKVQHDILSAKANEDETALKELSELKNTINQELEEGLSEFEKVSAELEERQPEIDEVNEKVEQAKKLYEVAKQNIESHGRKYLKGIVDPVKKAAEEKFQTIDLTETKENVEENVEAFVEEKKEQFEEVKEVVGEKVEEVKEGVEKTVEAGSSPINQAIDKTQESINRLLQTLKK